jgi:TolB-like protein
MDLRPGTRLGIYEIVAPLGMGGMGEVVRARDTRLGREVAIKALAGSLTGDRERLSRFRREAQTLASLNHPNIAAIYGLDEEGGAPYLILEFVAGETLADRLQRGALPLREALGLGTQVAAAVEAAHERGIVHRDLKPGNIMITPSGTVKVLDFGIAKSDAAVGVAAGFDLTATTPPPGGGTLPGTVFGTVAYMSPEQARGVSVDRRSDVWSFGCVLYECLSGGAPFRGNTTSDLIARILEREPDWNALPPGTPARVRDVLRRCLQKDAESRPRDIRDVRLTLTEVVGTGAVVEAAPEASIAVLPFENLSGADDEYFADGMTDEILNALAGVEGLRVAARTSCFAFKGKREDLRTVREKLDVKTVLEGSVRRAGPRLRITVQLVNTADGYQLWAERYDRELTDIFEVQEEIAKAIATRLRGTLQAETDRSQARRGTKNLEAYELLLRGRALVTKRGRFLPEAIACFERAVELDPHYAEALGWLADSYRLQGTFGTGPAQETYLKARTLAERALAIDPNLAEAWSTLASVEEQYERNFKKAEELWDRALECDPRHARARSQRALWGFVEGRLSGDFSKRETARAVQEDPLNAWVGAMHSHLLGFLEEHEASLVEAIRARSLDNDSYFACWNLMRCYAWSGRCEEALAFAPEVLRASGRDQWSLGTLGWIYAKLGKTREARAVHDELEARSRLEFVAPFWLATTAASADLPDVALRFVREANTSRDPLVLWGRIVPFWDRVRTLPGYEDAVRGVWG